jgi:prophage antirepressor-like protein
MGSLKLFEDSQVRSVWHEADQQWYFAVVDVVAILTGSADPKQYIKKLRSRDESLNLNWGTICTPLVLLAPDGKKRKTLCANVENMLRIIQSIPSPKAEPFKRWLAKVGSERLEEIENPELATQRTRQLYEQKGYSPDWIEKRLRGIAIRDELTDEWQKRGVKAGKEFAILTAEISKATFGVTPTEYKALKKLEKPTENLRDHMSDLELIFTMLGEASTTEIAKNKDAKGFVQNKKAAKAGGEIAGNARKALEVQSGQPVMSTENFKHLTQKQSKRLNTKKTLPQEGEH